MFTQTLSSAAQAFAAQTTDLFFDKERQDDLLERRMNAALPAPFGHSPTRMTVFPLALLAFWCHGDHAGPRASNELGQEGPDAARRTVDQYGLATERT